MAGAAASLPSPRDPRGGQEESSKAESDNEGSGDEGQAEAGDDGEYYVDEDGNKYKKFDDVQLKMLVCWNGGFKTADDQYNNDVAKAIRDKIGVTVEFEGINKIGRAHV